jgi:DNA-binding SARP family transcriptional activator
MLLAYLLVHAGRRVSLDAVCEAVWEEDPPAAAASTVRTYLSQFRRLEVGTHGLVISPDPSGYHIELAHRALDASLFERLLDDSNAGDAASRLATLDRALALWRGPPLAEFTDADWARTEAGRLNDRRHVAVVRRFLGEQDSSATFRVQEKMAGVDVRADHVDPVKAGKFITTHPDAE